MARPTISDETLELVNEECKAVMTANPQSITIDERIEILAKSHRSVRMQMAEADQFDYQAQEGIDLSRDQGGYMG